MKKLTFLTFFFLLFLAGFAQAPLLVQTDAKGPHLVHKVAPKEGIYALGRMYSLSPKEIAAYNNLDVNSGLVIGQTILIPLTESNYSQTKATGTPVYYTVGASEGLYRVSTKNGKVTMADLRKWNNLSSDAIQTGQKLIVGYLQSSEATPVANHDTTAPTTNSAPVKQQETPIQKPKPVETAVAQPPVVETKPEKKVELVTPPPVTKATERTAVSDGVGGYFKKSFEQQEKTAAAGKDLTATSGIFKTASGWQDAKYYALVDGVDPGTIVRVTNPSNNKTIYAKVLGGMTGIRQNQGFDVRISNAAAAILEVKDTEKFVVKVNY